MASAWLHRKAHQPFERPRPVPLGGRRQIRGPAGRSSARERLEKDGLPARFFDRLASGYVYRIVISAPDDGYHASYLLGAAAPPSVAFARALIDDGGAEAFRAQAGNLGK